MPDGHVDNTVMGRSYKGGIRVTRKVMMDLVKDYFVNNRDVEVSIKNMYEVLKLKTHPMRCFCLDVIMYMIDDGYLK